MNDAGPEWASTPELTVVLPTHNGERHLEEQLAALARQSWTGSWDIIFLNNGSTDGTRDLLVRWLDRMPVPARIVDAAEHLSLAYARNAGVAATQSKSVA
ncbi:MAG TPA: glycosyltransferase family A protein, partial [Ilumatobacter sp.]|nr:glycosyltransferase family A protein [Ilumatobacter sp.]